MMMTTRAATTRAARSRRPSGERAPTPTMTPRRRVATKRWKTAAAARRATRARWTRACASTRRRVTRRGTSRSPRASARNSRLPSPSPRRASSSTCLRRASRTQNRDDRSRWRLRRTVVGRQRGARALLGHGVRSGPHHHRVHRQARHSDFDVARLEVQTHVAYSGTRQLGNPFWVDGDRTPQVGRGGGSFANHSKSPNAEIVVQNDKIVLRALKPISPGDEIFVDYGSALELAFGAKRKELSRNVNGQQSITTVRVGEPQKFRELHEFGFTLLTRRARLRPADEGGCRGADEGVGADLQRGGGRRRRGRGWPMAWQGQVGRRVRKERQESSRRERPQLALHVAEEGRYARRGQG